jgi:hypothetical protein
MPSYAGKKADPKTESHDMKCFISDRDIALLIDNRFHNASLQDGSHMSATVNPSVLGRHQGMYDRLGTKEHVHLHRA